MNEPEKYYDLYSKLFSEEEVFRFYSLWKPGLYDSLGIEELGMNLPGTSCLGCKL